MPDLPIAWELPMSNLQAPGPTGGAPRPCHAGKLPAGQGRAAPQGGTAQHLTPELLTSESCQAHPDGVILLWTTARATRARPLLHQGITRRAPTGWHFQCVPQQLSSGLCFWSSPPSPPKGDFSLWSHSLFFPLPSSLQIQNHKLGVS